MFTVLSQNELSQDERPPYPVRRWTLDEYHSLIDQGMFDEERVEFGGNYSASPRVRRTSAEHARHASTEAENH